MSYLVALVASDWTETVVFAQWNIFTLSNVGDYTINLRLIMFTCCVLERLLHNFNTYQTQKLHKAVALSNYFQVLLMIIDWHVYLQFQAISCLVFSVVCRLAYPVMLLTQLLERLQQKVNVLVLYDIGCVKTRHLQVSVTKLSRMFK